MNAAKLEAIRDECFAEDIDLPDESIGWTKWTEDAARAFFESGGNAQAAAAVMGSATSPASSSAAPSLPTPPPAAPVAPAAPVSPARAAEPSLQPSIYRVAHAYVNVRDAPNLMGNILGKKCEGDELEAVARGGGDASLDWIRLRETFEGDRAGWLLVNGLKAGMAKAELLTRVRVRVRPDAASAEKSKMKRRGTVVSVSARQGDWVQLEAEPRLLPTGAQHGADDGDGGGWMLTDGRSVGGSAPLGILMRPHIIAIAEGTQWTVTRPGACTGYPTPAGAALGEAGARLASCTEGDAVDVVSECGLWVQVKAAGGLHWVEMDAFLAG